MTARRIRWTLLGIVGLLLLLACVGDAQARVGGGSSYSGSSSSSSSGGKSDNGFILYLFFKLIELHIYHPGLAIFVDIILIVGFILYRLLRDKQKGNYSSQAPTQAQAEVAGIDVDRSDIDKRFRQWRKYDPNFSELLLEDFLYALYANVHTARGKDRLADYTPFLSKSARLALRSISPPNLSEVTGIIVGSFQILEASPPTTTLHVRVRFETNYVERTQTNKEQTWYVVEEWELERTRDLLSKPPGEMKAANCPNCGAGLEQTPAGKCKYCAAQVQAGQLDWGVTAIQVLTREPRPPQLTSTHPEVGTDRPTIFQGNVASQRKHFMELNPDFDFNTFESRVRHIFRELQQAWTTKNWDRARPYETDRIFQMHRYWIEAFRNQGVRNVLAEVHIESVVVVKYRFEAFHDAITCRIFAEMIDYIEDDKGKVLSGNKSKPVTFSEYWTFIRRRGAKQTPHDNDNCPNCGAGLKINMAGECEYCGSKITRGDFDWVLSRIEQDESYQG